MHCIIRIVVHAHGCDVGIIHRSLSQSEAIYKAFELNSLHKAKGIIYLSSADTDDSIRETVAYFYKIHSAVAG